MARDGDGNPDDERPRGGLQVSDVEPVDGLDPTEVEPTDNSAGAPVDLERVREVEQEAHPTE
jgi:hypothetical protein